MSIDHTKYREDLSANFIALLDSERGVATKLAKSIGKSSSFINEIRRGKPVNAFHLKAVAIVFGPLQVLKLMAVDDYSPDDDVKFRDWQRGREITKRLAELERMSPKAFDMVATYITGAYEAAKATATNWENIEKGGKPKENVGFKVRKEGTNE
jgi:hypothetical protein